MLINYINYIKITQEFTIPRLYDFSSILKSILIVFNDFSNGSVSNGLFIWQYSKCSDT